MPTFETITHPEKNVKISGKNFFAMPTFGRCFLTGKTFLRKTLFSGKNYCEELCGLKCLFLWGGTEGGEIRRRGWGYRVGYIGNVFIYKGYWVSFYKPNNHKFFSVHPKNYICYPKCHILYYL